MANMHNNAFIHNTGLNEENSLIHLLDAISPDEENEAVLIEHSKYFDDLGFKNVLRSQNSKMCILSLNCQSINAKFDKLKMFIDYVNDQSPISVICIQESRAHNEMDMNYFSIPNYTMVNQNRRLSTHAMEVLSRTSIMILHIENSIMNFHQHLLPLYLKASL